MQRSLPARRRHSPCFPGVVSILGGEQPSRVGRGQQEVSSILPSPALAFFFSHHEPPGKTAAPNGHKRTASLNPLSGALWGPTACAPRPGRWEIPMVDGAPATGERGIIHTSRARCELTAVAYRAFSASQGELWMPSPFGAALLCWVQCA